MFKEIIETIKHHRMLHVLMSIKIQFHRKLEAETSYNVIVHFKTFKMHKYLRDVFVVFRIENFICIYMFVC